MSFVSLGGGGIDFPPMANYSGGTISASTIDATGEKVALCGRVWFAERTGTKAIRRVGLRFGAMTKTGGSGLTVSLQNIDLTSGPPTQPDGTQDQTVAVAAADIAVNTWHRTAPLSTDRTVSYGEQLAVVIEFDGSGRQGTDSFAISSLPWNTATRACNIVLHTSSWALVNATPIVALEFTDGTFGTLHEACPASSGSATTLSYNSGTGAGDEHALRFSVPFPCKVDGLSFVGIMAIAAGDAEVILYDGTTPLQTVAIDASTVASASTGLYDIPIPETELTPGNVYYLALKPTTANNVSLACIDVDDVALWQAVGADANAHHASRVDGGSWTPTATRRPMACVRISALDDGAGAGGGSGAHIQSRAFLGL